MNQMLSGSKNLFGATNSVGMFELTSDELMLVSGGDDIEDITGGAGGFGGGLAAVGAGLEMSGLAAGLVITGGALAIAGGLGLAGYGIYLAVK